MQNENKTHEKITKNAHFLAQAPFSALANNQIEDIWQLASFMIFLSHHPHLLLSKP